MASSQYSTQQLEEIWRKMSPEKIQELLEHVKTHNPEQYEQLARSLQSNRGAILEAQGYEKWLHTLGPHTFTGDFSWFHRDFWDWYWRMTEAQRRGKPVDLEDITYFAIWGRSLGKSSNAEWLAIAEGCLVGKGFVLYVAGTAEQAESHVEAIRDRLETEGNLPQMYPGMRKPAGKGGFVGDHKNYGWRQDYLMTANGWAVRPVGLDKAIRGWKRGDNRVSLIILDDIDDDDDSPDVISKKERRIAKKILPMGTARTKVVFAQNLIHSNSVLNRMHTRQTDILTLRRGDVPVKAFDEIETEFIQTPKGPRCKIISGKPTWPHIDLAECQSFLDRSGYDAFMAEYQHDFTGEQHERVLPEYDDRILKTHLITWDQFESKYNTRRIPSHWACDVGLDIGYTTGHKSAWTFLAKVPEGYPLAGSIFRYRGCVFTSTTIGEMETNVRARMWPEETIEREFMSHEKKGEQLVLNGEHGWHFHPCDSAKTAGIAQWRHYLRPDRSKSHPFHRDERGPDGLWRIGRPAWFDIVVHEQFEPARMVDDLGLKTHRTQTYTWKMRPVQETKSGITVEQPMKANEDSCFVAGTLIQTENGEKPIEKIAAGDMIWTRKGLRRCLRAWQTGADAKLVKVHFNNKTLICTPNHPIWTEELGFVSADAMRMEYTARLWQSQRLLNLVVSDLDVIQNRDTETIGSIFKPVGRPLMDIPRSIFTLLSGNRFTAKSQRATTSIISTMIRRITPSLILNVYQPQITFDCTMPLYPTLDVSSLMRTLLRPKQLLHSGTEAQRGANGMGSTRKKRWLNENPLLSRAGIVESPFQLNSRLKSSALHDASNEPITDVLTRLKHVAVKAVTPLLSSLFGRPVFTVPTHVKVESISERAPVFNITVEGEHEYFANGLLVKNCDSTRMLTVAFGPMAQAMSHAQKVNAMIPQGYHREELAKRVDMDPSQKQMTAEIAQWQANRRLKFERPGLVDEYGQPIRAIPR